jgi:coiled-coil domain-containing protein 77
MLPPTPELMEYYQQRCDEFVRLEEDYVARIQALQTSVEEKHRARWQYLRAESEVEDLQQALSDAKLALFDEKERVAQLNAENDMLKIQELEDRQRIQQLLSLTQPVTNQVTLFKEQVPAHLLRAPPVLGKGGAGGHAVPGGSADFGSKVADSADLSLMWPQDSSVSSVANGRGMLRTVFLPSQNSEALSYELQALRVQAEEQKRLWKEKEEVLLEDRRIKAAELKMIRQRHSEQRDELEKKILELESELATVTRDYVLVRHAMGKEVNEANLEAAAATRRAEELLQKFQDFSDKKDGDVDAAAKAVHERDRSIVEAYKAQVVAAEEEKLRLKTELARESIECHRLCQELQVCLCNLSLAPPLPLRYPPLAVVAFLLPFCYHTGRLHPNSVLLDARGQRCSVTALRPGAEHRLIGACSSDAHCSTCAY